MKPKRIMVVAAHPDDTDFYCGGALIHLARAGAEITCVVCTDGALGSVDPKVGPDEMRPIRRREQTEAGKALGVGEFVFLDRPDMGLRFDDELMRDLTRLYRSRRPEIVFTFDPWTRYEQHPDHTAAGAAGFYSQLSAGNRWKFPELLEEGLEPWAVAELHLFKTDRPNLWVDVEDVLDAKLAALTCHASQFAHLLPEGSGGMEVLRHMSRRHPDTGRVAEGFRRIPLTGIEGLKSYVGLE